MTNKIIWAKPITTFVSTSFWNPFAGYKKEVTQEVEPYVRLSEVIRILEEYQQDLVDANEDIRGLRTLSGLEPLDGEYWTESRYQEVSEEKRKLMEAR